MDYLKLTKKTIDFGDIFTIPLFLPYSRQMEDYIDYKKYGFRKDDIYAFGRLIDIEMKNCNMIEVFNYVGKIPDTPEIIVNSGRMFKPMYVVSAFKTTRWRFLFDNPHYDKWKDSDYENISFLFYSELWKGGTDIPISRKQYDELLQSGVPLPVINGAKTIEQHIRSQLQLQGLELHYEQIIEERSEEYPQPRDIDKKLKETITPFRWFSQKGCYSLSLDAGCLNQEIFEQNNLSGNGYDWEKVASIFLKKYMTDIKSNFTFDCEADTFSMQSPTKNALKEFSLAFHKCTANPEAFEELLKEL